MAGSEDTDKLIEFFEDESRAMSKSERTRFKIIASAAKVFNEKGFDKTSIQDIADDAGIAKGTIYYYVDKKEDLLVSLVRFGKARFFSKIEKSIGKATTASGKVETIIRNHLKIIRIIGPIAPFFAQNLLSDDSRVREVMAGFRREYLDLLESIIEEGIQSGEFRQVNSERAAFGILGMVIGQVMQSKVFVGKINSKAITENTLDLAISGLRKRDED